MFGIENVEFGMFAVTVFKQRSITNNVFDFTAKTFFKRKVITLS